MLNPRKMKFKEIFRYKYIGLGILAVTLASCSEKEVPVAPNGYDKDDVTITHLFGKNLAGRVTVDGVPRQGVVVSDGVNVEVTDENGEYQMYTSGRQHVFVSVPEDCEVPLLDGAPRIYKVIDFSGDAKIQRDFNLTSAPVKTDWQMVAVADPQIGTVDVDDFSNIVIPDVSAFAGTMNKNTYGIALGDIVWNTPSLFTTYKEQMVRVPIPTFAVIGNHDHNESIMNDTGSDKDFRDALGPTYYSLNIGDYHIVVLDDILYSGATGRNDYSAYITEQQLEWLEKDLSFVPKTKSILVALHIPTARWNNLNNVKNNQALYDLIKDYNEIHILSGHNHNNSTVTIASNIVEHNIGAAMGAYWYPICNDGSPRGYGILNFSGNKLIDKYYKGVGYDRDYQMKIYKPEDAVLYQSNAKPGDPFDKILVNVFDWHPGWTVEIQEDGGAWTALSNVQGLDPDVVKCLGANGEIPAHHGGSKPATTNHLFLYKPSASWKSVTVKATNPFGVSYTSTLDK